MKTIRILLAMLLLSVATYAYPQQEGGSYDALIQSFHPDVDLNFGEASGPFINAVDGSAFTPNSTAPATVAYHQPSTILGRTGAALSYDALVTAPNNSLGNYDWSQSWWAVVRINPNLSRQDYVRFVLFSKGTTDANVQGGQPTDQGYIAYLFWNENGLMYPCLQMTANVANGGTASGMSDCGATTDLGNGISKTILFTYDGSGLSTGIHIYVEGLDGDPTGSNGGGGPETGTPPTMTVASPLVINGDIQNLLAGEGNVHNLAGPVTFEHFAMGRGTLTQTQIQKLATYSRFAEQVLGPKPAVAQRIIWSNDGCEDDDNLNSLATAIKLHKLGYFNLLVVNNDEPSDDGSSQYQMMIDQAGLHGTVPVSASQGDWGQTVTQSLCPQSNQIQYGSYHPRASLQSDVVAMRTALAASPDHSVEFVLGGGSRGIADLLTSAADSISNSTGQQLFAAKVSTVHMQYNFEEDTADWRTSLATLTSMNIPVYWYAAVQYGGTGPGVVETRAANDPLALAIIAGNAQTRPSYDMWPLMGALNRDLFFVTSSAGEVVINDGGGATFDTNTNLNEFNMLQSPAYDGSTPNTATQPMATWFLNSLINPRPEPPLIH